MTIKNVVTPSNLGKGFTSDNARKKIDVAIDNTSITFNAEGQLQAATSDVDFSNLPEVGWKTGTKVLAVQDGRNVFMKTSGDIFTDVTLSLTTAKTSVVIVTGNSDTVNLVATVTNAGRNPATNIRLVLTKPQLGTYSLGTAQTQSSGATNLVKVNELEYTIEALNSGGTVIITIPVTYSKQGSFTFGGQVTSTIDTDTTNNSKTVTVSVTENITATGGSYVPTQDCPLFTVRDETLGVTLNTTSIWDKDSDAKDGNVGERYQSWRENLFRSVNIYGDKNGLSNRRFKLSNVEQIVLVSSYSYSSYSSSSYSSSSSSYSSSSFSESLGLAISRSFEISQIDTLFANSYNHIIQNGFTFDKVNQTLTFDNSFTFNHTQAISQTNVGTLMIYVKPKGNNCKWQVCVIKFTAPYTLANAGSYITHNSSLGDKVTFKYDGKSLKRNSERPYIETYIDDVANWVGVTKPTDLDFVKGDSLQAYDQIKGNSKVVITIKKGTRGTFTLTATDERLSSVITKGEITTNYNAGNKTLTVTLNNPQPQNSIKFEHVEFKVID